MNEALRKKLVFMTLPLALLYAGYNLMSKKPAPNPAETASYATVAPITVASIGSQTAPAPVVDRQRLLAEPWGRDPFRFGSRPLPHSQADVGDAGTKRPATTPTRGWVVNGILYSDARPIAYINRKAVTVGDMVDNAKVIAISKTSVTLECAGKTITVSPH